MYVKVVVCYEVTQALVICNCHDHDTSCVSVIRGLAVLCVCVVYLL